jgi:hypothetical protein
MGLTYPERALLNLPDVVVVLVVALAGGGPQLGAVLVADRGVLAAVVVLVVVVALAVVLDAAVGADLTLGRGVPARRGGGGPEARGGGRRARGRGAQLAAVVMRCRRWSSWSPSSSCSRWWRWSSCSPRTGVPSSAAVAMRCRALADLVVAELTTRDRPARC